MAPGPPNRKSLSIIGKTTLLLLLITLAAEAYAQNSAPQNSLLFITSSPLGARVILDGNLLIEQTPLLLKTLSAGKHRIKISKEGFKEHTLKLKIAAGEIASLNIELERGYFSPSFTEEKNIVIHRTNEDTGERLFNIQEGTYKIRRKKDVLEIKPQFPQQGLINALNLSIPITLSFSALLAIKDLLYPKDQILKFSPATISSFSVNIAMIGIDAILWLRRGKFKKTFSFTHEDLSSSESMAKTHYEEGENMLASSKLNEALHFYSIIINNYRETIYVPLSLYKIAKIHYIMGRYSLAALEFQLIIDRYPLAELYDKAQKDLAGVFVRQELYEPGIEQLDEMVLFDPLFSREGIDYYRCEIFERWLQKEKKVLYRLIECLNEMVQLYADSKKIALYRYKLAYYLNIEGNKKSALAQLNLIENLNGNEEVNEEVKQKIKDLLESIMGES